MFHDWYPSYREKVDAALTTFFSERYTQIASDTENRFQEAMQYTSTMKGKRIRPILAMIMYEEVIGLPADVILPYIIGIEFLHSSFLVHDDLQALDNDEFRSGEPSLWKKYDEATAILVGDALQALGIECLSRGKNMMVVMEAVQAIGDMGMIRGQIRDLFSDQSTMNQRDIIRLQDEKTAKLISASLIIWGLMGGMHDHESIERLRWFGVLLGRAFQVRDDIMDFEWVDVPLGKTAKKDIANHRGMVAFMGINKTKDLLQELEFALLEIANTFQTPKFSDMVEFIVHGEVK